jgi:hypothetical protein
MIGCGILTNSVNNMYNNFYTNNYNKIDNTQNVNKNELDTDLKIDMKDKVENGECKTCSERVYQDDSDDPSVSFQTPGYISPESSASKVMSHEMEHVTNEKSNAENEDKEIVSQSVSLKSAVCPECGKNYIAGGETVTTTKKKVNNENDFFMNAHNKLMQGYFGNKIDTKI